MTVVFPGTRYQETATALLSNALETSALILATPVASGTIGERLLVREVHIAPDDSYLKRSRARAQVSPQFLVPLVARAKRDGFSLVFAHTHPSAIGIPEFSEVDDAGETELASFLSRRIPNRSHAALVIGPHGASARRLGTQKRIALIQVGRFVQRPSDVPDNVEPELVWDRQVRVFGREAQRALSSLHAAVIGLGGTGSITVQQLAYLGIRSFTLIDPDSVDETNLNRLVGANRDDVGRPKTEVVAAHLKRLFADIAVTCVVGDITNGAIAPLATQADVLFSCTDSHSSRALLNQIAYQYYIPMFDMGVSIGVKDNRITHVAGRAQMIAPGLPCLVCSNVLDPAAIRNELMSPEQRIADPYFIGHREPQPAVISINSVVASLSVTMFLSAFTQVPAHARLQFYNAMTGTVRAAEASADPTCIVCSPSGALGVGDEWELPVRTAST